jgi:4-azaleucine resistance transporter AzlC
MPGIFLLMHSRSHTFFGGFRHTMPLLMSVIPFGVLYATIAGAAGFPWWITILFSIVVYGGSSQLVFIDLFRTLGSPLQAAMGANIVNARHLIYSAGVSRKFSHFPLGWRLLLSYLLTDQLFAISKSREAEINTLPKHIAPWYFFGSGACTWGFWVASTGLGILFGHFVPASLNLGFSIPLIFMPLVFMVVKSRYGYLACLCALLFVFLFQGIPYGLGVFFAIVLSSLVGYLAERWVEGRK